MQCRFGLFSITNGDDSDVWEEGNKIIEGFGYKVDRGYYKNSKWLLPGLIVENHRWLIPFRGDTLLTSFERLLQDFLRKDTDELLFKGSCLYKPPFLVSALFLIEHAYSHFLHEGLTWRHVLDWMMFSRKHLADIDWHQFEMFIDDYGFRKFYDSYYLLGQFLLGEKKMNPN